MILNLLQLALEFVEQLFDCVFAHLLHLADALLIMRLFIIFLLLQFVLRILLHLQLLFVQILQLFIVVKMRRVHSLHELRVLIL